MARASTGVAAPRLSDRTVFVGGPFSAALKFNNAGEIIGFDETLRAKFERVYAFLRTQGAGILSSHLAEAFGADVHETTLVQRDNAWLRACDLYLAVLPFGASEPYRTDGTFVEIGMAIGLSRPCLLLIEQPRAQSWSYYVRNLGAEELVSIVEYEVGEAMWLSEALALLKRAGREIDHAAHIEDPHTLNSLVNGGVAGHTVRTQGLVLRVPAGALSPRYDQSLRALCSAVVAPGTHALRALAIGGGAGELAISLLSGPDTSLTVYEPDGTTRAGLEANLRTHGLTSRVTILDESAAKGPFDLVAMHLPPLTPSGAGPFAKRRSQLLDAARQLLPLASKDAQVYLGVTSFNQTSDVFDVTSGVGMVFEHLRPSDREPGEAPVGLWKGSMSTSKHNEEI